MEKRKRVTVEEGKEWTEGDKLHRHAYLLWYSWTEWLWRVGGGGLGVGAELSS